MTYSAPELLLVGSAKNLVLGPLSHNKTDHPEPGTSNNLELW
jgi:hypothetical protein